eukprot:COSAG02_NODE_61548_length_268_cov_0.615385_1_plen_53_part_10
MSGHEDERSVRAVHQELTSKVVTQVFERLFTPLSTSLKALSTQFDDIISDQFD